MFRRNVVIEVQDYTASHPSRLLPGSNYAVFVEEFSKQKASLIIHIGLGGGVGGGKSVLAVFSI